jgi:signal transduction histidine kinase
MQRASAATLVDEFPKSAIVRFPMEASPISSLANVLIAAGAPAVVIGADRSIKLITDDLRRMFSASQTDLSNLSQVERLASIKVGDLATPASWTLPVRNLIATLVPLSGGAGGAVLVFRPAEGTLDETRSRMPKVTDVVRSVADRFAPFAELKGVRMQIDAPELDERFREHGHLGDALGILMDNSLHYVPPGGQVVAGVRMMEYKSKPLFLFFVMDNGAIVPEHMRQVIFEPGFVWNPASHERTGRSLSKVRDFAMRHGGSVWTEAKSGKACTFFLRLRPDGVR